jgi:hypothetical protein
MSNEVFETSVGDWDIKVHVTHFYSGAPGRTSGPPENCYPEDPPEIEYSVELMNCENKSNEERISIIDNLLTEHDDDIQQQALDHITECEISAMEEAADQQYEESKYDN